MIQKSIPFPELGIRWDRLWDETGNGGYVPEGDSAILFGEVREEISRICRPMYCYEIHEGRSTGERIEIGKTILSPGKRIAGYLTEADRFAIYAGTAGVEFEEYCRSLSNGGNIVKAFFADLAGSVIAETVIAIAFADIAQKQESLGLRTSFAYSPGHCEWSVADQKALFSLLPPEPCGIRLTESGLMIPVKSVSNLVGIGRNIEKKPYGCAICTFEGCYKKLKKQKK